MAALQSQYPSGHCSRTTGMGDLDRVDKQVWDDDEADDGCKDGPDGLEDPYLLLLFLLFSFF
jgi:hypothetical protein